uniref:DM10 domain-containing protein n=1 Tax=Plectus sambesii TaxID=2011161 RepID=A0A914WXU0_9BILA
MDSGYPVFDDYLPWSSGYYPRSNTLQYNNGFMVPRDVALQNSRHFRTQPTPDDDAKIARSAVEKQKRVMSPFVPNYVKLDNQVLMFNGYFEDPVFYNDHEIHRIRPVKIYYHLIDDTISVTEPAVENSGLMQGRIFRRQKVPKNSKILGSQMWHWSDMNIGMDVDFFSRTYRITSCDPFTTNYLKNYGIRVNSPELIPSDPWMQQRWEKNDRSSSRTNMIEASAIDSLPTVPAPEKLILYGAWLDKTGDHYNRQLKRFFELTVFTKDDTVMVSEFTNGLENPLFLKRMLIPRPDSEGKQQSHYRALDFRPGVWINLFERAVYLYDCDNNSTRPYLQQQFGDTNFRLRVDSALARGPPAAFINSNIPHSLKFKADMVNPPAYYSGLTFIITYEVDKQKITIYEQGKRHKWSHGRSFLETVDAKEIRVNDLRVGAIIPIYRWQFYLTEADHRTQDFMRSEDSTYEEFELT